MSAVGLCKHFSTFLLTRQHCRLVYDLVEFYKYSIRHQDPNINIFVETWVGLEFSAADLDVLLQHHWPDVGRVLVLPLKQVDFARGKAHNTHRRTGELARRSTLTGVI